MNGGAGHIASASRDGATRRSVLAGAVLVAAGGGLGSVGAVSVGLRPSAVIALHGDRLYVDRSGTAEPFRPPVGLRSLEGSDEADLRHLVYAL